MNGYLLGFIHASVLAIAWFVIPNITPDNNYALGWILSVPTLVGWIINLITREYK